MEYFLSTIILIIVGIFLYQRYIINQQLRELDRLNNNLMSASAHEQDYKIAMQTLTNTIEELKEKLIQSEAHLEVEKDRNDTIVSQKKSSETRLGQITEQIVPFIADCPYDPKSMHFLGNPIDFLVFDLDQGEITFLEVKTGNSKPSKKQKVIKNIIKAGRVFYSEIRVNEKGTKHKRIEND